MANTKESRVIRTRNIATGVISFLDKPSKKTLVCEARDLFEPLNDARREAGLYRLDELFDYEKPVEDDANWLKFWLELPSIIRHLILHGINAKVGDTVAAKDKDGFATMSDSWKALCAGTWSQGGGGSPLDTYTVVLRETVSDAMVAACGMKRVDADKATRDDIGAAYLKVVERLTPKGGNVQAGFDKVWPKVQAGAKTEAARRDKAAPKVDVEAILAAATVDVKDAA